MQETLIRQLAQIRAAAQPALASRCDKAVALGLTGKVHLGGDTHALVASYREPGVQYTVNSTCSCQDAKHGALEGWCAHCLTVDFVRACPPDTVSETVRGLLDAPPTQPIQASAPPAATPTPEGWCVVHSVQIPRQTNSRGSWYSHRLPSGSWCKGK